MHIEAKFGKDSLGQKAITHLEVDRERVESHPDGTVAYIDRGYNFRRPDQFKEEDLLVYRVQIWWDNAWHLELVKPEVGDVLDAVGFTVQKLRS